jgi:tRNA-splicing ligase RtcB
MSGHQRSYAEELAYLHRVTPQQHDIVKGFVPNMRVPGTFYVNDSLLDLQLEELQQYATARGVGGFLPAVKQIANVAALPGIVGVRARCARGSHLGGR